MVISRVDDFRFFGVVAASRSLTEAGRTLGISVSAVSRRLSALENDLGVDLVVRNPRSLTLTPEGRRLADGARKLAVDAEALEAEIRRSSGDVAGPITVRCTLGFGREHVAPVIAEFQAAHPEVTVFLELSSEPVDLSMATFDLMVSVGTPKDSALVYRRLVSNRRVICASPAYLRRHGAPREPRDLHAHRCLLLDQHDVNFNRWEFVVDGEVEAVTVDGDLRCNDGDVVVQWCLEGKASCCGRCGTCGSTSHRADWYGYCRTSRRWTPMSTSCVRGPSTCRHASGRLPSISSRKCRSGLSPSE